MKKGSKLKTILVAFGIMLLFLAIQLVLGMVGGIIGVLIAGPSIDQQEYLASIGPMLTFISEIVCIAVFGIWYYKGYVKKDKDAGTYVPWTKKIGSFKTIGFILFFTLGAHFAITIFADVISMLLPSAAEFFNNLMNTAIGEDNFFGIISVMLLAPIAEELAFRGVVLKKTQVAFGAVGCAVISAVMFGIMHLNPLQSLYVLPMGLMFSYFAIKYNSVIPAIFSHLVNNSIAVIVAYLINRSTTTVENIVLLVAFFGLAFVITKVKTPQNESVEC
ncbi:CPBP family intramembrane glutamic endopeptidase [Butyrivibrio sp. VCD2006]|uniref:CPBP family intramembrane glutamic endopeptidase n=1 Tax=Butyrivibrio sp. VCD2006 TaxID=1280664 RepID=UPI0004236514|nr:type II CAAX endopeptidase family protein [Butyrivibrio sp. VCD2006]